MWELLWKKEKVEKNPHPEDIYTDSDLLIKPISSICEQIKRLVQLALEAQIKYNIALNKWSATRVNNTIPCCEYASRKGETERLRHDVEVTSAVYWSYAAALQTYISYGDTVRVKVNCKTYDIKHENLGISAGISITEIKEDNNDPPKSRYEL